MIKVSGAGRGRPAKATWRRTETANLQELDLFLQLAEAEKITSNCDEREKPGRGRQEREREISRDKCT